MTGIQFITDEAGQKTAVVIDLKKHKALWEDMYAPNALDRLRALEDREAELSKSSMAIPNKTRVMRKWQSYVIRQHGLTSA